MSRPVPKKNENIKLELFIFIGILILLLFTSLNIMAFVKPKKVLGVSTVKGPTEEDFWNDFLNKNPDYIPGWTEQGRVDKVKEIDPNYFMP